MKTPLLTFAVTISITISFGQHHYATTLGWTDGQTPVNSISMMTPTEPDSPTTRYPSEPRIKEGRSLISEYILSQVEYPDLAREYGIEGMTIVKFEIDRFGQLTSFKLLKQAHPLLDASVLNTIKTLPKIEPAVENGIPVDATIVLPIRFYLR